MYVRTCGVNNSDPTYIYTQMLIAYLHIVYANCRYIHTIGVLYTAQSNGNYIQLIYIHTEKPPSQPQIACTV